MSDTPSRDGRTEESSIDEVDSSAGVDGELLFVAVILLVYT